MWYLPIKNDVANSRVDKIWANQGGFKMSGLNYNYGNNPNNQYNQSIPAVNPYAQEYERERLKSEIRINEAAQKANIDLQKKLQNDSQRQYMREQNLEYKDSLYEDVYVDSAGNVCRVTKNSRVDSKPKVVFNFSSPKMTRLVSTEGEDELVELSFDLFGKNVALYLETQKLAQPKYILGKVYAVGGNVCIKKESDAMKMISKLISLLMIDCDCREIPAHYGWNKNKKNRYFFVERGEVIWKTLKKISR